MNRKGPGMDQGMSAMKNMSENGMGHGRDMASKAHEMGKKIHDKIKDMKGYFNRSRRAVPSFIEIQVKFFYFIYFLYFIYIYIFLVSRLITWW